MARVSAFSLLTFAAIPACGFEQAPYAGSGGSLGSFAGSTTTQTGGNAGANNLPSNSAGALTAGSGGTATTGQGGSSSTAGSSGAGGSDSSNGSSGGGGAGASSGGSDAGGASSGGTTSGGSGGTASGGSGPTPADPHFTLLFRDDFDTFDTNRWSKATHTFAENLARFTPANAVVEGGMLKLRVTNTPNGNKQYSAAEVYTNERFTFGRFEGRIKFCAGSGMVSSLFTYKDDVNTSWQEIDIEHLGYLPKSVQYNLVSGNLNNRVYQPKVVNLDYAPPAEFHDYAIEWTPDAIRFFVDGELSHQDVQASIKDPARLRMNAWPADYAVTTFAGPLNPSAIPCESTYDWVQVFSYVP
jgi:hypothetical protein